MTTRRLTASQHVEALSLTLSTDAITASAPSRTLAGDLVRYGTYGRTSMGRLRVRPGALRFPDDISRVILTREHDRGTSRGVLAAVHDGPDRMRVQVRASAGPEGDAALQEAQDGSRSALSFDAIDVTIDGDEITDGLVIAIGQVGIPAYDDSRIDAVAASFNPGDTMTPEQRARLAELAAMNNRSTDEEGEFQTLQAQAVAEATANPDEPAADAPAADAAAPAAVAASMPAVAAGVPAPETAAQTASRPRGTAYQQMVAEVSAALSLRHTQPGEAFARVTAALSDIVHSDHTGNIEQPAWSGELWSGLEYEIEWSDLLAQDTLTHWKGQGWRFTQKLEIQDYAGDKAAIPTGDVVTEESDYEAARMAIGVDIDRKFYDFGGAGDNSAFVNALFTQVRESWEIKKDVKARAFILGNVAVGTRSASVTTANADATVTAANGTFSASDVGATISGAGIPNGTTILSVTNSGSIELSANATASATVTATIGAQAGTLLKAAARASLILKRRRVGRASWVVVNDEDMFSLLDVAEKDIPAFLELWNIDPKNFRSSADVPRGTVLAGASQAAKFRQLPGSPIRVSAQNLVNGGVDEAFFGYWAIEEHHTSGLVSVGYRAAA